MTRDESEALAAFVNASSGRYTATALTKGALTAATGKVDSIGSNVGEDGVPQDHYWVILMDREVGGNPVPVGDAAEHLRRLEDDRAVRRVTTADPTPASAHSDLCALLGHWLNGGGDAAPADGPLTGKPRRHIKVHRRVRWPGGLQG